MVTTNQKSAIDTQTKKKINPNTTVNVVIKSQEKRTRRKERRNSYKDKSKTINKMAVIITLNVNRLNMPTKTHRLTEWLQKQNPYLCYIQETHLRSRDT